MKIKFLIIFITFSFPVFTQIAPEDVVHKFFQAMAAVDTAYLEDVLVDEVYLSSSSKNEINLVTKSQFIRSVANSKAGELDEQISNLIVNRDGGLANVWMDYSFYYQKELSHCGVNNFSLALDGDRWKIVSLSDSRRSEDCISYDAKVAINQMLDQWHLGATTADSTSYFDLMAVNSIYVGTDKEEVWSKREFLNFAAPYFAKGKAWSFTRVERNIYSKDYMDVAWFDEVLDTWMGACRGSGVVVKDATGAWKIQHYVLSVAVNNSDINKYLNVIGKI